MVYLQFYKSSIYLFHNFYVALRVLLSPLSHHTQGISNLWNLSSMMSCIVLYRNLVLLGFIRSFSMPKPASRFESILNASLPHQEPQKSIPSLVPALQCPPLG